MEATETTVEKVRDELRSCLFALCFDVGHWELANQQQFNAPRDTVRNLIAFGLNSSLISQEEFNDWMSCISGTIVLGDVTQKWMKEA